MFLRYVWLFLEIDHLSSSCMLCVVYILQLNRDLHMRISLSNMYMSRIIMAYLVECIVANVSTGKRVDLL